MGAGHFLSVGSSLRIGEDRRRVIDETICGSGVLHCRAAVSCATDSRPHAVARLRRQRVGLDGLPVVLSGWAPGCVRHGALAWEMERPGSGGHVFHWHYRGLGPPGKDFPHRSQLGRPDLGSAGICPDPLWRRLRSGRDEQPYIADMAELRAEGRLALLALRLLERWGFDSPTELPDPVGAHHVIAGSA